jgi:hypothetical protein
MIQGPLVPEEFIPRQYVKFDELNDAYDYYCDNTKMVGFDVQKGRKSPQVQHCFCNKEGYNDSNSADKQKEKGSMRIGCKGHVKVKLNPKEGCWYFDAIDLYHNHQLHPEKRMTCFMRSHKIMEDGVKNLMEVMMRTRVQHQALMNVMSELYDGWDKWTFTEGDMSNRYDQSYNMHSVTFVK